MNSKDIQLIKVLIEEHAAKSLIRMIDMAVANSRGYAEKVEMMRESASQYGREPQKPYNEIDYRTCELLKRQAERVVEDSWMALDEFTFDYDL